MKLNSIYSLLSCLLILLGLSSCEGEKDLIIIDGNLPIKTSTLYMVGDATPNGWSIDAPTPLDATEEDPLVFTWQGTLNPGEMKLCLVTGSWDAPFIRPSVAGQAIGKAGLEETAFKMHAGDPDDKWKVTDAGVYSLRFDLRNWTMSASFVGEPDAPVIEPIVADALYIVGDATPDGWNIDAPTQLEKKSDYIYVYEGPLATGELKACIETGSWDAPFIRPNTDGVKINKAGVVDNAFVYAAAPDNKWRVEEAGIYRLTFDLAQWTITAEYTGDYTPARKLYLIGDATEGGWSWDAATEIVEGADGKFTWEGELGRGNFKASFTKDFSAEFYRPAVAGCEVSTSGAASSQMVLTTDPDDQWLVTVAGNYRLTFDVDAMTFTAVYLDGDVTPEPLYMIGTATAGGWSLDDATEIAPVSGQEGVYSWTGHLNVGTFKACKVKDFSAPFYRPSSSSCNVSEAGVTANDMVFTTEPDDQWNVLTEGTYQLTLDTNSMTINVKFIN